MMVVATAGHRPQKLGGFTDETNRKLIMTAEYMLAEVKPTEVISGMALGWDIAVAYVAHQNGLPVIASIPCYGQELKWSEQAQKTYHKLLQAADYCHIEYLSYADEMSSDQYVEALKMRNRWMVRNCNKVVALWNGDNTSGTWHTISFAEQMMTNVINYYDVFTTI
jgi:uncharacterized phage-like protein YoqJ